MVVSDDTKSKDKNSPLAGPVLDFVDFSLTFGNSLLLSWGRWRSGLEVDRGGSDALVDHSNSLMLGGLHVWCVSDVLVVLHLNLKYLIISL